MAGLFYGAFLDNLIKNVAKKRKKTSFCLSKRKLGLTQGSQPLKLERVSFTFLFSRPKTKPANGFHHQQPFGSQSL